MTAGEGGQTWVKFGGGHLRIVPKEKSLKVSHRKVTLFEMKNHLSIYILVLGDIYC